MARGLRSDSTCTHWHRLYGARLESKEALLDHQAWRMHEGLVAAARQRRLAAEAARHDT